MWRDDPIGILSTAVYVPEGRITAAEIAARTGGRWSEQAIREKLGIQRKAVAGPDDGVQEMGARAARLCLERAGLEADQVDVILCIGDELREYPMTTSGIYIQEKLGARNAWAADVMQKCSSFPAGVRLARALLRSERDVRNVLLAGGYRNGDMIDYGNPRVSFMYNLAPGGGAALVSRGTRRNEVLGVSLMSDGALSRMVLARYGGTSAPVDSSNAHLAGSCLDVVDQEGMRKLLAERSHPNFLQVIREALAEGGLGPERIDYLAVLHMKRSAHHALLADLGLTESQTTYLSDHGHLGQFDQLLSIELGMSAGKLKDGDIVVGVGAGIGYSWGAVALRWGTQGVNAGHKEQAPQKLRSRNGCVVTAGLLACTEGAATSGSEGGEAPRLGAGSACLT
jgi:3-oxoacyl-[acyl-carrier-protein] synthase-3